jgi:hypothetical protein
MNTPNRNAPLYYAREPALEELKRYKTPIRTEPVVSWSKSGMPIQLEIFSVGACYVEEPKQFNINNDS